MDRNLLNKKSDSGSDMGSFGGESRNDRLKESSLFLKGIKNVIAVASGKGGVGKSTVTTNLASALSKRGAKVGILDADIYGPSQTLLLGKKGPDERLTSSENGRLIPLESYGIKLVSMGALLDEDSPVVWRAPMAVKIIQEFIKNVEWGELDYLLVDLPPGTGDIQLTLAQQAFLTGALIVTTPQQVAVGVASKGLKMFQQLNVPILGIVENMGDLICKHCGQKNEVFGRNGGVELAQKNKTSYLGNIPLDPTVVEGGDAGIPVLEKDESSVVSREFINMAESMEEVIQRLNQDLVVVPENVKIRPDGHMGIYWSDGAETLHRAHFLRYQCPCASCVDENTGERIIKASDIPLDIKILSYQYVGRYGLSVRFSDGHSTGIYGFSLLRSLDEIKVEQSTEFEV